METESYELFVVQSDTIQEQTFDKIVMYETQIENFLQNYLEMDEIEITGLFGCQIEIQKCLLSNYGISSLNDSHVDKGKIFGIQQNQKAIICLILQEEYFLNKPIDEKSIQITLVRIFCDLTQNIQLCFSEKIFQNWYQGDYVRSTQNKQIIQQYFPFRIKSQYKQQSQLIHEKMTPYFLYGEINKLTADMQTKLLATRIEELAIKIFQSLEKNEIFSTNLMLEQQLVFQDYDPDGQIQKKIPELEKQIKNMITKGKVYAYEVKQLAKKFFDNLKLKISDKIIFTFQRQLCKIQRKVDQIQNDVSQIYFESEEQIYTQSFNFGLKYDYNFWGFQISEKKIQLSIQAVFRTKDNSELFIFLDQPKHQSCLYILPKNQAKWNYITQLKQTDSCLFHFDQKTNILYAFNSLNNKQIHKFEISDKKILQQYIFCEQVYQGLDIIVNQVAYLSFTKNFLLLQKDHKTGYQLYTLNEESKIIKKIQLQNQKRIEQNIQLLSCPSGKYFYLSNYQFCDMYDCDLTACYRINLQGNLTILTDNIDVFLLNLLDEKQNVKMNGNAQVLKNVIELSSLLMVYNAEVELQGNPGLDLLKGSSAKFGPLSDFLFQQISNRKNIYLSEESNYEKVLQYFKQLNISEFYVQIFESPQFCIKSFNIFKGICYSRVPIQLCTIENGSITPLIDGFRRNICLNEKMDVNEKAEQLRFGFLEKYLNEMKEKIFVVCIIGKQSSGKSYLLNRIFGTRYSVASCRCNDGIWASFAKVEDQNFLILDCEGQFSSIRSQKEEVQLLALLTALSDVTLLNQDLTFSRYLEDFLENLSAASDQLVGDTLFKGVLTIFQRDISSSDNSGVDEELISKLNKQKSGDNQEVIFLRKLFNSKFNVEKLLNFENKWFDDQIVDFRKMFLEESKETSRWLNGEQLVSQLKILLCQLEMCDKTNSSLLLQQLQINRIFQIKKKKWLQLVLSLSNQDENEFQEDKTLLDQNDIVNSQSSNTTRVKIFQDPTRRNVLSQSIQFKFISEMKFSNQSKDHNTNITKINEMVQKQTQQKKILLLELIDSEFFKFNKQLEILDYFNSRRLQFQNYMQKQIVSLTFCMEKCNFCFLKCTKFKMHDYESILQLELTSIKIQEIQNNLKKLGTISDEQLIELKYQFEQNQKKQNQLQKTLQFCETFKHCQSLKNTYQTIQAETESFFPLKNLKECFSAIQVFLENELEVFQDNQEPQIQAKNFENLKQGKQRLIQKVVEFQNSIKQIKDQLNEKKQNVLYFQSSQNEKKQKIIQINQHINNQEKSIEILTIEISEKLKQNFDQQQRSFYEKINKRYLQVEEIDSKMLQIELKKNQDAQKQIQSSFDVLENQQQDWKEAISIFQKEDLTVEEFFQLYQKQNEVFAKNNQKIQKLKLELETIKNNNGVNQLQNKFKNNRNQIIQAQTIQQAIKQLEQEQSTEMNIEIEYISELIKTNQNQQINKLEQEQQAEMNIEIEKLSDLIKTNQNQEIIQNKEEIFYKYRVKKDEEKQEFAKQITQFQKQIKQLNEEEEDLKLYLQLLSLRNQIKSNQLTLNNYYQILEDHQKKLRQVQNLQQQDEKQINIISSQIANLENESKKQSLMKQQINSSISKVQMLIDQYPQFLQKLQDLSNLNEEIKKIQKELRQVDFCFKSVEEIESIKFANQAIDAKIQTQIQFQYLQKQLNQLLNEKEYFQKNIDEHSCQRLSHFCDEQCCVCEGQLCKLLAGHNGEHLCEKLDHLQRGNSAVQNCAEKCSLKKSHVEEHLCQKIHQCQYCTKQCEIQITKKHQKHTCGEIKCNKQCCLCESYCKEYHEHFLQPDAQHLCSKQKQEHCCNSKCQKQGVCI